MAAEAEGVHERKSNLAIPWRTANNVERANEWIRVGEIERGVHAAISHCTDRCRSAERARGAERVADVPLGCGDRGAQCGAIRRCGGGRIRCTRKDGANRIELRLIPFGR